MRVILTLLLTLLVLGCATVSTEQHSAAVSKEIERIEFPPFEGEKKQVTVVELSIPQELLELYPELADNRVGWGIYNRIVDTFYETGRFEFIEDKSEVKKKIFENWKLKASGITMDDDDFEIGNLKTPDYFIYAEIFEFAVRQDEKVRGVSSDEAKTTIVGVQLRIVDAESGTFIPASGIGEVTTTIQSIFMNADADFDQSTVGLATDRAVRSAVLKLIKRM